MAKKRRLLVANAAGIDQLKVDVMRKKGFNVTTPSEVKYEVAKELNIPLENGYNGTLTSTQAGKVGGQIGGSMVKEMIEIAKNNLK